MKETNWPRKTFIVGVLFAVVWSSVVGVLIVTHWQDTTSVARLEAGINQTAYEFYGVRKTLAKIERMEFDCIDCHK